MGGRRESRWFWCIDGFGHVEYSTVYDTLLPITMEDPPQQRHHISPTASAMHERGRLLQASSFAAAASDRLS